MEGLLVKTLSKTNKQYELKSEKCVVIKAFVLGIRSDENSAQWPLWCMMGSLSFVMILINLARGSGYRWAMSIQGKLKLLIEIRD